MRLPLAARATSAAAGLLARLHATPRARRWAAVAAWMALIFVMSAQPASGEQSGFVVRLIAEVFHLHPTPEQAVHWHHLFRKGAHFTEYAILAALTAWALPPDGRRWLGAWGIATAYAATDEFHQAFVPNRGPAVMDVGIDSLGAATAVALLALAGRLRRPPGARPRQAAAPDIP